jgi:hypothetical protein
MAGFIPAIHGLLSGEVVDARDKLGHDGASASASIPFHHLTVIPAKAGIQSPVPAHSRESGNPTDLSTARTREWIPGRRLRRRRE